MKAKLLPFRKRKQKRMDKKLKTKLPEEDSQPKHEPEPKRDEKLLKKSVILPAYVWNALENDSKRRRRTMAKQIEVILVNHYALDPYKIDIDEDSPGGFGYIVNRRAAVHK